MSARERLWCMSCEADDCECGAGWTDYDTEEGLTPECPCCGNQEVQP